MKLSDFVPPLIMKVINREREREREREFETYASASDACSDGAYENDELCRMIAAKTRAYRQSLEQRPYSVNAPSAFLLSLINQYIWMFNTEKISIVDFGGACGAHYFEIRRLIPSKIVLNWYVVETPRMVAAAKENELSSKELQFTESLESIKESIDLLHSSGALQYVPAPYEYLARILGLKAKWLLFTRMMFNNGDEDIITLQRSNLSSNGPGALPPGYADREMVYPHTTMSLQKFQDQISISYQLNWEFNETSGAFRLGDHKIVGKGLFLVARSGNGIQQDLPAALAAVP